MDNCLALYPHFPRSPLCSLNGSTLPSILILILEPFPHAILFRVESCHSTYHPQPLCLLSIDLLFSLQATLHLLRDDLLSSASSPCIASQKTKTLFLNSICKSVFMCVIICLMSLALTTLICMWTRVLPVLLII